MDWNKGIILAQRQREVSKEEVINRVEKSVTRVVHKELYHIRKHLSAIGLYEEVSVTLVLKEHISQLVLDIAGTQSSSISQVILAVSCIIEWSTEK